MAIEVKIINNRNLVQNALREQIITALEAVGIQAEGDVKDEVENLHAVDTGRLRSSITHKVVPDEKAVYVGTNVNYAVYVHEGTGAANVAGGTPKKRWAYRDPATGEWRIGTPQKPRRFIKKAVEKNAKDYGKIIEEYLSRGD